MNPNPCTCPALDCKVHLLGDKLHETMKEETEVLMATPDKATDSMYDRFNGGVDTEALLGNPPGIPVHPFEQEAFLAETDKLISEINTINQRMAGIPRAYPRHPHSARLNAYKKLYDDRKTKVLRIQEINKICIEKGYIQA